VTSVVLDASALIAFLRNEPGADMVRQRLPDSIISAMNYSEVLKKTIEVGGSIDAVRMHVNALPVSIIAFDIEQAVSTASLYPLTKPLGLSFADRACLALGIRSQAAVLTTEKKMAAVKAPVKVVLVRGQH
jgi:PIN domain nuclease of toxin-antitoxin system